MQGVLYASAYLGISLVTYVVGSWITYFYTPPVDSGLVARLSPTLVGIAVALGRIVDAVADPLVGAASDRLQSPRGRRLPFMRGSVIPLAAVFALLWTPPAFLGEAGAFLYLSVSLSLFFILYTLYVAPYLALLPELATRRDQRIAWSGWQGLFNIAGTALGGLGAGLLIEAAGFAAMGGVLALVAFASLALPAWLLREREGARGEAPPPSLVESVRLTMANPAFRPYVAGQFFFWLALYVMIAAIPYLATVVMGGSEADATVALGLALAVALLALVPLSALSRAVGLKKALNLAMGWFAAVLLLAGGIGRLPLPLSPYAQGLLVFALAGVPLAALFVFPNALLAEVTDIDFQRTGSRREAVYFGVQGFIVKLAVGLSALVTTGIIDALGYSREAPWGVLALGPVSALLVAAGIACFRRYPAGAAERR
ncbi:MAG: MFS transporter [Limnochordia bacterium]